jgi:hypothetical protein
MKKFIIIAASTVLSLTGFSNTDPINSKVLQSFKTEFKTATNVEWKTLLDKDIFQASFKYQNSNVNAFFNSEGELIATSRYIDREDLPMMIKKNIEERYPDHKIGNVIENNLYDATSYHVTLHSQASSMVIVANNSGDISVYKKVKNRFRNQ